MKENQREYKNKGKEYLLLPKKIRRGKKRKDKEKEKLKAKIQTRKE